MRGKSHYHADRNIHDSGSLTHLRTKPASVNAETVRSFCLLNPKSAFRLGHKFV